MAIVVDVERQIRRHEAVNADAIALKEEYPEMCVCVPAVVLEEACADFVKSLSDVAARADMRGAAIYTTISGRAHRIDVIDLEPEIR